MVLSPDSSATHEAFRGPDGNRVERLRAALAAFGSAHETATLTALLEAASGRTLELIRGLAAGRTRKERQLALALTARLAAPPPELVVPLTPLLGDARLSLDLVLDATTALFRSAGDDDQRRTVLAALTRHVGKARALGRLIGLEARCGRSDLLQQLRRRFEERLSMNCPLCPTRLRQPEMARHLWDQHRLLLDGGRVREPWRLLEEWLDSYRRTGDAGLLESCRQLAGRLDPVDGNRRLERLLLTRKIADDDTRQTLKSAATAVGGSLCPHCYQVVPPLPSETVRSATIVRGRIALAGFVVDVDERGLVPTLEVYTPGGVVYRGPEPGQRLTRHGALALFAGPPLLWALFLALTLGEFEVSPLPATLAMLGVALVAALVVAYGWRGGRPLDRAIEHAWRLVAPTAHAHGFHRADALFLAGLARLSGRRRRPARVVSARRAQLPGLLRVTEQAVGEGVCPLSYLAALRRRAIEDAVDEGGDRLALVAAQLGRCFLGQVPFAYAEHLLARWEARSLTDFQRSRLRVLLCDRAFEAGFELGSLATMSDVAPQVAEFLGDTQQLARLRLLWSLRAEKPWDFAGEVVTVFELAEDADAAYPLLVDHHDLLFVSRESPEVIVDGGGLIYRGVRFSGPPSSIVVKSFPHVLGTQFQVLIDERVFGFRTDPTDVAELLEEWFRFVFRTFAGNLEPVKSWQPPFELLATQTREAQSCQECGRSFLPRVGAVGVPLS